MQENEKLTRFTANFIDELAKSGLAHAVISPGSRSTPLAMTVCEHPAIQEWIVVDERTAAYFALGMAKQTKMPVALICTSGTAAANYFPALIEAYYNRVPLIVLTADRPHELRDIGAPQVIDQIKLFGEHVKWFHEMSQPESTDEMLAYVRTTANRAIHIAKSGNPGPVHINFPFRDPLVPNFSIENLWGNNEDHSYHQLYEGKKQIREEVFHQFNEKLITLEKGLIVCGPQEDEATAEAIAKLADRWQIPVLADPLSQLRAGKHDKDVLIENYDSMFRDETLRNQLKPDFIIRFGAMPVSKYYDKFTSEHQDARHIVVEPYEGFRQPTKQPTEIYYAHPVDFINGLLAITDWTGDQDWLTKWQQLNKKATNHIEQSNVDQLTEGVAVRELIKAMPTDSVLYVGNSMAVRDLDTFFMRTDKQITLLANRGVSGIEGLISSALGAAATTTKRVTLLIGDLAFYHDLNGLLIGKQYELDLTILLMNNNGGGIFSFLPQANEPKYFEKLFGTPLHIDFKHAITMYQGTYRLVDDVVQLKKELQESYQRNGTTVIEVRTDREENMRWHRQIWQQIADDLTDK